MTTLKLLIGLTLITAPAMAQPWRYVDRSGAVHYTSNPYELPAKRQKQALAQRKAQQEARKARLEAKAEQKAAAAANAALNPEGIPAPVAQPVTVDNTTDTPKADPKAEYTERMAKARQRVLKARTDAGNADRSAQSANHRALVNPSGFAYDANKKAKDEQAKRQKGLIEAEAALQKLQRAQPR
jgi:hypothetical protein